MYTVSRFVGVKVNCFDGVYEKVRVCSFSGKGSFCIYDIYEDGSDHFVYGGHDFEKVIRLMEGTANLTINQRNRIMKEGAKRNVQG